MRETLQSLNLHDLNVLSALLQDGSVTKAAERMGQSQPAVSRTLRRLREVLDDPLFVRSGRRLAPTERAAALRAPLREILAQVARIDAATAFDPVRDERTFTIACADCLPPVFLPMLIERLAAAGPRIRVRLRLIDPAFDVGQALEEGRLDLVVNNSPRRVESGECLVLQSGERVTLEPGVWHEFRPLSDECIIGEVSTANDDANDNIFINPDIGRFPHVDEDEPAIVRLLSDPV